MKLKKLLAGILNDNELSHMVNSFDLVGDILIIDIPQQLQNKEKQIGTKLLESVPHTKVIAKREGPHHGTHRIRNLVIIAGEQRKETLHKENGITLHLNPWEVYYSVRSSNERLRIANEIKPGEKIAILGSGAAPFPLVLAKHSRSALIIGIEKNPQAHSYAIINLQINKLQHRIKLLRGNAATLLPLQNIQYDRILNILPTNHIFFLPYSLQALRPGGILNHYAMVHKKNTADIIEIIKKACHNAGHRIKDISIKKCGHCGSQTDRCCFTVQL